MSDTNIEDKPTDTTAGHVIDDGKVVDATIEGAQAETEIAAKEKQDTKDKKDIIRINELTDVNIFAFLIMLFTGNADDDTINKLSQSLGLGDSLKDTINAVRSGDMSAITAAARTYSSIDTKSVDWKDARSVINGDTYQGFIEHIKLREGYENTVYRDNEGNLTVGVGHLVTASDNLKLGETISDEQVIKLLEHDSIASYNRAKSQADELGINDKEVIAGLASVNFQLGLDWNKEHKDTWALMQKGDFNGAITEVADSKWNDQTRVRVQDFQAVLARASEINNGTITAEAPENLQTASLRLDGDLEKTLSNQILKVSRTDNAYGGYCAKGVANILENLGLDVTRGNAHTWIDTLPKNGWVKLEGVDPTIAPIGSVLIYDRNTNHSLQSGGGRKYGHVEQVAENENGDIRYVSDKARSNWGGTVPGNFAGVYLHPEIHGDIIASLSETKEKSDLSNTFANAKGQQPDEQEPDPLTLSFDGKGRDQIALAKEAENIQQVATLNAELQNQDPASTPTQQI